MLAAAFSRSEAPAPGASLLQSTARSGRIACRASFDFAWSLRFLRGFGPMVGDQEVFAESVTKGLLHRGQPVLFTVRAAGKGELSYELVSEVAIDDDLARAVIRRVRAFLSTDEDLAGFYALAASDAPFAARLRELHGLHHVRFLTPFEAACWGLINQRVPRAVARHMKESLYRRFGRTEIAGRACHAFPEAATIAACDEEELVALLKNERKGRAIAAAARAFAEVDESFLEEGPLEEVASWLSSIYGVGDFTTAFVLFRGLGRFRGRPTAHPGLLDAMSSVYGEKTTEGDLDRRVARYGAWGGHYMLYLWASTFEP